MTPLDLGWSSGRRFLPVADRLDEDFEAARRVGMMSSRVQPAQVRMSEDLNGYSARAARRSAIWFMPQSERRADASAHRGD